MLPFLNLNNFFLNTLIQNIFFKIMKLNFFRGDLTDISAKKEALDKTIVGSSGASSAPVDNHFFVQGDLVSRGPVQ